MSPFPFMVHASVSKSIGPQLSHARTAAPLIDPFTHTTAYSIGAGKISLLGALGPEFEDTLREHHAMQQASATAAALPEQQLYGSLSRGDERTDIYLLKPQTQERLRMILRPFFHKCVLSCDGGWR